MLDPFGLRCWLGAGLCLLRAAHCLRAAPATWLPGAPLLSHRAGERPELCRVSLPEFQQFLLEYQGVRLGWTGPGCLAEGGWAHHWRPLMCPSPTHSHQELWAVDRLQVQEFMLSFLRDPLREIEEPYFSLDEVSPPFTPLRQNAGR